MNGDSHVPPEVSALFEVHDFLHASAILKSDFKSEFEEICNALMAFKISKSSVVAPGGNESDIPKGLSKLLRPLNWKPEKLQIELTVSGKQVPQDTHVIDYVKGRVALDMEWNSKDQTFDRDLFAFQMFHHYGHISVGVILTRGVKLSAYFKSLGSVVDKNGRTRAVSAKYGASTTHMGKLIPRLSQRRNGGCPVLVLGITPASIVD